MSGDIVISVRNVSKDFKLPHESVDSIKSIFVNPFNKNRKKFEMQHALRDISFDIPKGEFFGIVGRNGSGKSTLLKIIANIYQANKGKVVVSGRLVPFIELGVGFNPQLTGRENVYLNGALLGFSEKEVDAKYDAIVDFAELERFMDQKLKNYSSGMQVRLAFSVATILAESDILLIDEVLAVGDADFQRKCFEYFKKLKKENKTVIFVSHNMTAIREYCDKAILIDKSQIVFSGSSEETAQEYSKLFSQSIYDAGDKDEYYRLEKNNSKKWGSGGVDITKLSITKKVYTDKDDTIELSYEIHRNAGFEGVINPGFLIKNEQGSPVFGTNTDITLGRKQKIVLNEEKKVSIVKWAIPNIFNGGKYTIDVAVLSGLDGDTLQWWDESISFRVINERSTPYSVSPRISVNID